MSRNNYCQLRFTNQELSAYQALAGKAGIPLAVWIRNTLNASVRHDEQYLMTLAESDPEAFRVRIRELISIRPDVK